MEEKNRLYGKELKDSYDWVFPLINKKFKNIKAVGFLQDYDSKFNIIIERGRKGDEGWGRIAFRLDFEWMVKSTYGTHIDEDGEEYEGYGPPHTYKHFSLNADENPKKRFMALLYSARDLFNN